jgi:hypothetical protein
VKKQQLDHVLRAAGEITGEKRFVIIGSQALHGKYPDLPDDIVRSVEVDLMVLRKRDQTELLNEIGVDSLFHQEHGIYADPVDETTAKLPKGWKNRLVNLKPGDTGGVKGMCLEVHDLAIAKYAARREKDLIFTRELARRGVISREKLLSLVDLTPVGADVRRQIRADIASDFDRSNQR